MASSGNFCVLNRADPAAYQIPSTGNLRIGDTGSSTDLAGRGSTFYVKSGKWYWEIHQRQITGTAYPYVGISVGSRGSALDANRAYNYGPSYYAPAGTLASQTAGYTGLGTLTTTDTGVTAASTGDIINFALDMDNRKFWIGLNGTFFNSGNPATGTNAQFTWTTDEFVTPFIATYTTNRSSHFNFGQDSSFAGEKSTGTESAADANGHGDFYDTPPSGFLALCSANLPTSSDIDPAETDNDYPAKQFGAETFTGNGGTQTIQLGDGFQPDFVWLKNIGTANSWVMLDSTRGYNKTLNSNNANAEGTNSYVGYGIESNFFGSTGIVANDGGSPGFNASTNNYIVYGWRANGGTTSTNTSGTITSTVQANTAAGFSIVTYTGDGNDGASIGHGLSSGPNMIFVKNRDANDSWAVYHSGTGNASHLILDTGTGVTTSSAYWNSFTPSSTVFKVGTDHKLNASTEDYVAYCWHDVEGFQKFGGHVGSGNADGPFIYTGFRPRMIMIKRTDGSHYWYVIDSARTDSTGTFSGVNPITSLLNWDDTIAASTHGFSNNIHFLGNGFKMRTSGGSLNGTGDFIYAAWGDVPFKYNNTLP